MDHSEFRPFIIHSFIHSFIRSFVRSFVRSLIHHWIIGLSLSQNLSKLGRVTTSRHETQTVLTDSTQSQRTVDAAKGHCRWKMPSTSAGTLISSGLKLLADSAMDGASAGVAALIQSTSTRFMSWMPGWNLSWLQWDKAEIFSRNRAFSSPWEWLKWSSTLPNCRSKSTRSRTSDFWEFTWSAVTRPQTLSRVLCTALMSMSGIFLSLYFFTSARTFPHNVLSRWGLLLLSERHEMLRWSIMSHEGLRTIRPDQSHDS